jgi:hypothetical protein
MQGILILFSSESFVFPVSYQKNKRLNKMQYSNLILHAVLYGCGMWFVIKGRRIFESYSWMEDITCVSFKIGATKSLWFSVKACSMHEEDEKCIPNFSQKTSSEETTCETEV